MMKPGRELDALVAKAMGSDVAYDRDREPYKKGAELDGIVIGYVPNYSTDWAAAEPAWEWLQKEIENNPPEGWEQVDGQVYLLALADYDGPAVMLIQDTDFGMPLYWEREPEYPYNWYIPGETYPHAIALAVVEAGKAKREVARDGNIRHLGT